MIAGWQKGAKKSDEYNLERYHQTKDPSRQVMWERFPINKRWAMHLLEEAANAVQRETDSSWQNVSPNKEELELLPEVSDLRFDCSLMRQTLKAEKRNC